MASRKRSISSVSIVQVIAMVVLVLIALIGLAFMFAKPKPVAPPRSHISYEARPPEKEGINAPQPVLEEVIPDVPAAPAPEAPKPEETVAVAQEPVLQLKITGVVLNAGNQQPINNASITAVRKRTAEDRVALAALDRRDRRKMTGEMFGKHKATSDESGAFTLDLTQAGVYEVVINSPGFIPFTVDTNPLTESAAEFRVEARLSAGASISGTVTESGSSKGAAGVTVRVESPGGPSGVTDADGKYVVEGLATGEFGVAVDLRGSPYMAGKELPFRKVSIKSADQRVENVDFVVEAAGVVWGYVLSPDKTPISGANVMLSSNQSMVAQALSNIAKKSAPINDTTMEDGYYELTGVPFNEEWLIHAMSGAYAPQLSEPFLLSAAQRNVRIDIYMFAGTNVYGQVVTADGKPVPGADVVCIPAYSRFFSSMTAPQAFRNSNADGDGLFTIQELPAGEYQLFAQKEGFKISPVGVPIYPDGYSDLNGVKLVMNSVEEGSFAVYGKAVDDKGLGVDGVNIRLAGVTLGGLQGAERTAATANGGQFRFDGVATGQYTILAEKDGYSPTTVRRVRLNDETKVLMRQTAMVRGRVLVKGSSTPLESYEVAAYPLSESTGAVNVMGMVGDNVRSEQFFAPDGSYELSINAGSYRLEATAANFTPARAEIKVEAGQVLEGIDLTLDEEGGVIGGTVFAADSGSVAGATVTLLEASSPAEALMMLASNAVPEDRIRRVDTDGVFSFDSLPAGEFVVIAQHPGYPTAQSELIILEEGGREENVRVRFGAGGGIEGYVYSEGQAVPGAVLLVVGNGTTQNTNTDESGYYYLDGLSSGVYQAMVTDVSSGDLSSIYDARGVQLNVEEGVVTRYDFGTQEGARIEGQCVPGPTNMLGGRAVLVRPGFSQAPLGETVDVTQLMGQSVGVGPAGGFLMEDIMPGEWQLDIYYFELGVGNPLEVRYVHSEFIQVEQGEVLPLVLNISY